MTAEELAALEVKAAAWLKDQGLDRRAWQNLTPSYAKFAAHVLEEYKAGLVEWIQQQANFINDDDSVDDRYARSTYKEVINHIQNPAEEAKK